jgi:signal transduction histidine kinase
MRINLQTGFQWLILLCGFAVLAYVVLLLQDVPRSEGVHDVSKALFLRGDRSAIPTDTDAGRVQALPHDWSQTDAGLRAGWYRITLHLDQASDSAPERQWAVYLPTVHMNAAVYLNGKLLGNGGHFIDPVARNWNRPLYFPIPSGLLQPGDNRVDVRIKTDASGNGYLSAVYVGAAETLMPFYEARLFVKTTLKQFITLAMLVVGFFMVVLWLYRRTDPVYGWFALILLLWAVHNVTLITINLPLPSRAWDWLRFTSVLWFVIATLVFVKRFLGQRTPLLERSLYSVGLLASLALALAEPPWLYMLGERVTDSATFVIGVLVVWCVVREQLRRHDGEVFLIMMAVFLVAGLGGHDILVVNHVIDPQRGHLLLYGAPIFMLSFAAILLERFTNALTEAESLNRDLGERVEERSELLASNYDRLHVLERQRVLVEERERIMRDMHDGIGGQLVSTLALIECGETDTQVLSVAVRRALDDLRLMIDSLEEVEGDLLNVLGAWRQRVEPYLVSAGLRMDWRVQELPRLADFGPQKALQVMRILQEAVANIIKHAAADSVTVETGLVPGSDGAVRVWVAVQDNGRGLCTGGVSQVPGRGLYNMRRRAHAIGADLEVEDIGGGTRVALWLPLPQPD